MKIQSSEVEIDSSKNETTVTLYVRLFSKKWVIVSSINSSDLAHVKLREHGLRSADKYLNRIISRFNEHRLI